MVVRDNSVIDCDMILRYKIRGESYSSTKGSGRCRVISVNSARGNSAFSTVNENASPFANTIVTSNMVLRDNTVVQCDCRLAYKRRTVSIEDSCAIDATTPRSLTTTNHVIRNMAMFQYDFSPFVITDTSTSSRVPLV